MLIYPYMKKGIKLSSLNKIDILFNIYLVLNHFYFFRGQLDNFTISIVLSYVDRRQSLESQQV